MAHYLDSFPEHHISIQNKTYIYFGGTAYLGLQTDVDFQNIFIENIRKYGTNYGASRKSNIRMTVYNEAETYLSKLVGSEACISMSSGYLAGQLVAHGLNTNNQAFFYAPNTHSALKLSSNKSQSFSMYEDLKEALHLHLKLKTDETPVVFLDAVDFSGSHFPDFEGLKTLPLSELILVVDDSHGIGILGERGGGIYKTIKDLNPKELIVCASLGKGFGVQAGAIFGCKSRISSLENTAFFGGSSPASPVNLATLLHSEGIYNIKRKQLKHNTDFFINNMNLLDKFQYMIGHPAFSFSDEHLNNHLESNGIIVTSFRYPDENSPMMSRIVISASHTETDILRLCEVLNNA